MQSSLQKAILNTIIYADIFDYPLTINEITNYLITVKSQKLKVKSAIQNSKFIEDKKGFYFLKGRDGIVTLRQDRERYSKDKINKAREIIGILKLIPSVKFVGITGALAMLNGKKEDDIDLFIITKTGAMWTTRFIASLFVEITGMRRHPGEKDLNNKICLNMFADENYMEIPKKEQDLFSAHEVVQMKPIFDRNETYQKFLGVNVWVRKYLPNAVKTNNKAQVTKNKKKNILFVDMIEGLSKRFQLWYMKNKRTTEVIKEGIIRFHPKDARVWVMRKYKKRLTEFIL